jgi:hypothetical protein
MAKSAPTIVSKMAVKSIGCDPMKRPDDGKPLPLCVFFGKADGIKEGEGRDGRMWSALTGSFAGVNLVTGDEYRSGKLFLPSGIHEIVENAVKSIKPDDTEAYVKFALQIAVIKAANPIGYSYQATKLIDVAEGDELSEIREQLPATAAKQLAAPAAAPPAKKK